jgi:hypothetical protein
MFCTLLTIIILIIAIAIIYGIIEAILRQIPPPFNQWNWVIRVVALLILLIIVIAFFFGGVDAPRVIRIC